MENIKPVLAAVAGILAFVSFVPYLVTTLRGTTKPNRVTWSIWTLQGWILTGSYYVSGGTENIWLPLADTLLVTATALLSLRYGVRGYTKLDIACLVGATLSLLVWIIFDSPISTLYMGIIVSLIGALPTIRKAYLEPETENALAWGIFSCAALLNILALPSLIAYENIYPFYLLFVNGIIFLFAFFGKKYV